VALPVIAPIEGQLDWLELATSGGVAGGFEVGLFTNNFTPTISTIFSDAVEPTATWYSRLPVSWQEPPTVDTDGQHVVVSTGSDSSWIPDAPAFIYGWFVSRGVLPARLWVIQKFDPGPLVFFDGLGYTISPFLTQISEFR
jgi:hypothetical protein